MRHRFLSGCSHTRKNMWLASQRAKSPTYRQEGFLGFSLKSADKVFVRFVRFVVYFRAFRVFRCYLKIIRVNPSQPPSVPPLSGDRNVVKKFRDFCDFSVRLKSKKPAEISRLLRAEREGFEPPVPRSTAVFKTAVIDHSTISPSGSFRVCGGKGTTFFGNKTLLRPYFFEERRRKHIFPNSSRADAGRIM